MSSKKRNYTAAMGYNNDYETVQEEKKKLALSYEINQIYAIPFTKKDLQSEEGIQTMLRWFENYNQNIINKYNISFTKKEL